MSDFGDLAEKFYEGNNLTETHGTVKSAIDAACEFVKGFPDELDGMEGTAETPSRTAPPRSSWRR